MFRLTKRRKFILSSLLLTLGLGFLAFGRFANRYLAIAVWSALCIPLYLWSLLEGLVGWIWLLVWILPVFFTLGVGLFYFLLPTSLLTAIPIILLYFLGIYALFLSENIFTVASQRTIQLYRSASAIVYLLTLFTCFLLYDTVFSFRLPFWGNFGWVLVISFFLFLHFVWTVELEEKVSKKVFKFAFVLALILAEMALALSFWPSGIALSSLFLTAVAYVLLGLTQAEFADRLFKNTIREYLIVGFGVFLILLFYTSWG